MQSRIPAALGAIGISLVASAPAFAAGPFAFVASGDDSGDISVVDLSNPAISPTPSIPIDDPADNTNRRFVGVAVTADGSQVFVADQHNDLAYGINTADKTFQKYRLDSGSGPKGVAIHGTHVYVAEPQSNAIAIIDRVSNNIVDVNVDPPSTGTPVGANPSGVAVNPAGTRVYFTDSSANARVCKFDAVTPPATVGAGANDCVIVGNTDSPGSQSIAVNPTGTKIYVVNSIESTISVIDAATFTVDRTFSTKFANPTGITVNSAGTRVYVGLAGGQVAVIDTSKLADTTTSPIIDMIDDPDTTNPGDPNAVIGGVDGLSMSPDGTRLCVVDQNSNMLHLVDVVNDADTVVTSVPVSTTPISLGQITTPDVVFAESFDSAGPK